MVTSTLGELVHMSNQPANRLLNPEIRKAHPSKSTDKELFRRKARAAIQLMKNEGNVMNKVLTIGIVERKINRDSQNLSLIITKQMIKTGSVRGRLKRCIWLILAIIPPQSIYFLCII